MWESLGTFGRVLEDLRILEHIAVFWSLKESFGELERTIRESWGQFGAFSRVLECLRRYGRVFKRLSTFGRVSEG